MNDKIGRNDPCHCGSGKKYKKYCLTSTPSSKKSDIADFVWHKLRQLEGAVIDNHLIPYAMEELPDTVMTMALEDFLPENLPEEVDTELLFTNFFMPWFLFNWIPLDDFGLEAFEFDRTIAENYIGAHERELNSRERHFMEAMNKTFYSFYSVLEVNFEKSLVVKDIILGSTHLIKERQGTHYLKRGDIVFTRVLTLDKQSIFVGMAPFIIPAVYHNDLIDLREWLIEENENKALDAITLRDEFDIELLGHFFALMDMLYNKPFPTLVNTDDEPFQFSKSHFKLSIKPEEALVCLLPLTLSKDPEPFLQKAECNKFGAVNRIEFPWLKRGNKKQAGWENTVLGHVTLEDNRLILETNSEKRTQKGKKLLTKYLGDAIDFQHTLIESPEQKLQSLPAGDLTNESNELMALPEMQEQLQMMAQSHWQNWFNEPIPALGDQTPRQAAKTKKGRERLEALLLQYERYDQERGDHPFNADIDYLKSELEITD